jgi:hypothetical protein
MKNIFLHLGVLGVAGALAAHVWTKDEKPSTERGEQVEVWGGKPDAIKGISFESNERKVRIEPRKDKRGRWYVGHVERSIELRPPPVPGGDAGAVSTPPAPADKKQEKSTFVSVEQGGKLAESLAPLYAYRAVGKIDDSRAEEFGLHKPEGTLRLEIDGKSHALTIGGTTPGGADRYARLESGEVYAIPGSIAQNLMFAESRLVVAEGKKDGWALPESPGVLDETAGNWMTKLGRLRVMQFLENPPESLAPTELVVRVEYFDKTNEIGFVELGRLPPKEPAPDGKAKPQYVVKSEHTRWYAEVLASSAEQVEQDLASVLK